VAVSRRPGALQQEKDVKQKHVLEPADLPHQSKIWFLATCLFSNSPILSSGHGHLFSSPEPADAGADDYNLGWTSGYHLTGTKGNVGKSEKFFPDISKPALVIGAVEETP
jgi:hypothetical protein